METIRLVAYRIALLLSLFGVHNVFHVSQLKKCITDPDVLVETNQPEIQPNLTVPKHPMKILDRVEKTLKESQSQ